MSNLMMHSLRRLFYLGNFFLLKTIFKLENIGSNLTIFDSNASGIKINRMSYLLRMFYFAIGLEKRQYQ